MIFAALLAVSCGKSVVESPDVEPETEQKTVYPEIQVALSVDTKTAITDNGDDTFSVAFEVDDDIAVFNGTKDEETHLPCRYRCTRIDGGVAYFSYNPTSDAERAIVPDTELTEIVAIYPFRGTTTSWYEGYGSGTVKFRMLNTQSSSSKSFVKASLPLVASAAAGSPLAFHHTVGMMQLNLTGSGVAVKKIVVTSDQKIAGNGYVEYESATPTLNIYEDAYPDAGSFYKATYTFGGDSGIDLTAEGTPFYIGLPEGTHNLSLLITDAGDNTMTISAPSVPISRGVVLPTTIPYTADPLTNVTNLSAFGHFANCYVVSKAGNYCFNARKPDGTLVSGASATWVWASGEACTSATTLPSQLMSAISYSNGKIYFTAGSGVGNVVLGVVDGSSNLLYTWHIWLADSLEDTTSDGITVMDRNLGAGKKYDVSLGDTGPLQQGKGNFYQWGRKDPFLGGRNSSAETTAFTNGGVAQKFAINTTASINNVSAWSSVASLADVSVEGGAANPLTMTQQQTGTPGYIAGSTTSWSERPNANPCPYGYAPISKEQFETLQSAAMVASNLSSSVGWGQVALGTGGIIFPRAGARTWDGGKIVNSTGSNSYAGCWTNTASSATASYVAKVTWKSNTELDDTPWSIATSRNSFAYNVRCVKVDGL